MTLVVVCGGRDFTDRARVFSALDALHKKEPITCVVEGGARGADALAAEWAFTVGVKGERFGAAWDDLGKRAGIERNTRMLTWAREQGCRGVVAFAGGRGTEDCCRQAAAMGLNVWKVPA